jgi:RsiW-degrading membrane proteinase PrsW (M82 family)
MLLLALAVSPGIAVCLFIYSLHQFGKGSMRYLIVSFLLGALATLVPLGIQWLADDVRNEPWRHSIGAFLWYAYVVVALSEEGSKFLVLRWYAYPKRAFREPFDGIIYSVMIGMGFATVENIEYVRQFGLETGVSRFFLAIPAHAAFAVLMGYPVGQAKFATRGLAVWLMARGLLVAVFFHGSFDLFLFLQQNRQATKYLSTGVLSFGTFATFYIAVRLAMRALRSRMAEEQNERSINYRQSEKDG